VTRIVLLKNQTHFDFLFDIKTPQMEHKWDSETNGEDLFIHDWKIERRRDASG